MSKGISHLRLSSLDYCPQGNVFTPVCDSVHRGGPGGLCPRGPLSGGLCQGVSVQGRGLCPGEGSLSRGGVSVQGRGLCPGGLGQGGREVSARETPHCTVMCRRYASYWNTFLFDQEILFEATKSKWANEIDINFIILFVLEFK